FLMKDAYSFDLDYDRSRHSYNQMFVAYLRTFARMGIKAIPMKADSGPIGGDMSHEFIVLADTGESAVFCHKALLEKPVPDNVDYDGDLQPIIDDWTSFYAVTDEKHDPAVEAKLGGELVKARGIEVGHIFHFGAKYSTPMNAVVAAADGSQVTVMMGSYGIGVSRLVGAIIEASHDDAGIIWPDQVAPFKVGLINLKAGDAACDQACDKLYGELQAAGMSVLYDDRNDRPGVKFADMDLIGIPWQVVVGPKGLAKGQIEIKRRATGARSEAGLDGVINFVSSGA
ncbi:MAG: proline--tRNA ligase, partial [Rhodobacteraceae bacterium]|nr:proline--tRNA ligase [Paracoccaceae bacterium]